MSKLNVRCNHRKMLFRNLVRSLIINGSMITTRAKAKAVKPIVEKIITRGKKYISSQSVYHLRMLSVFVGKNTLKIAIDRAKKAVNRNGGYTRVLGANYRAGDNAKMSYIGFVD